MKQVRTHIEEARRDNTVRDLVSEDGNTHIDIGDPT